MATDEQLDAIAVIGMSGRFPGAKNIDQFWRNLRDGVESISRFTAEDLMAAGYDPAVMKSPGYVNAGGALDDIDMFDAGFFGYNPRESEILDPQQRLFLMTAWETLENAGYDPFAYEGLIGVFAGSGMSRYLLNIYSNTSLVELAGTYQIDISNDKDHLTTRTAYKLNLRGPAVTIQTACSTSLVAICVACSSLLNYECDMALAGGSGISVPQRTGYFYQEGGIGSPDGHCRAFDARAQGTVNGSGVAAVLLKRLADAIEDGDTIQAVVLGSAINNDGSVKVGYTAPSVDGQAEVIATAQAMAGVEPETISYVEAHGTGTVLGDPIEIAALTQVFRASTDRKNFCAIGSVKTNVGHLDPAAGVTSFIKTVLALKHKEIPPSLHYSKPNPKIDFANSPFFVNDRLRDWQNEQNTRRAGVSSFGIGGTNAHVVLEEAPTSESSPSGRKWELVLLSARSENALGVTTANLAQHLGQHPGLELADVAYTSQLGRRAFRHRRFVVGRDVQDVAMVLRKMESGRVPTHALKGETERPLAFMFPGQGAQYPRMAQGLYEEDRSFRQHVDRCSELITDELGLDLREIMFPEAGQEARAGQQLAQTALAQPAIFIIEYALAQLLLDLGLKPQVLIGHSLGEHVAACVAGVFPLEVALEMVVLRGRLMQQMPAGAMLAVSLDEHAVRHFLNGGVEVAVVNGPEQIVVSGTMTAVEQLEGTLSEQDIPCRRLNTSHAFHSAMMDPILESFRTRLTEVELNPPQIPFISNVTGTLIEPEEATDPGYWVRLIRQTVRFADGVQHLLQRPEMILLEVGPGRTLSMLARQHPSKERQQVTLSTIRHPRDQEPDMAYFLDAVGQLWLRGVSISWQGLYRDERRLRVPLPTYPFENKRYWVDPPGIEQRAWARASTVAVEADLDSWFYAPSWQQSETPRTVTAAEQTDPSRPWLVFMDDDGLGQSLVDKIRSEGSRVITVGDGERLAQIDDRSFSIDLGDGESYSALMVKLHEAGLVPHRILHLASLSSNAEESAAYESSKRHLDRGFHSLVALAQGIGALPSREKVDLLVVSNGTHMVSGQEHLLPEKATILGPCKVIPQEYENISCRLLDIVLPGAADDAGVGRLVGQIVDEAMAGPADRLVAYRGDRRWIQHYRPIRLETTEPATTMRKEGIFLITGGLGGIGLELARYLADEVKAKVALLGRSGVPPRSEWEDIVANSSQAPHVLDRIQKIQAIEAAGGEVLILPADVSDLDQMRASIEAIIDRFGDLHGVIHAAGVPAGGIIQLKQRDEVDRVMAPKVTGVRVLEKCLEGRHLDFLVLFSSLTAVLGGAGQVDYCAANAFLDAYAHSAKDSRKWQLIAINWDRWREVGMAVTTALPRDMQQQRKDSLAHGINTKDGIAAFQRIMQNPRAQVAVSTMNLEILLQESAKAEVGANGRQPTGQTAYERPDLLTAYVAPESATERDIVEIWQELLGIEPVGINDDFFDLGGHSLLAIQLNSRLNAKFQVEISARAIFDASTVAALAGLVDEAYQAPSEDVDELARLLSMVEELSEDELKQLLDE